MPQMMGKDGVGSEPVMLGAASLISIAGISGLGCWGDCRGPSAMLMEPNKPSRISATARRATPADMTGRRSRALRHGLRQQRRSARMPVVEFVQEAVSRMLIGGSALSEIEALIERQSLAEDEKAALWWA